MALPLLLGTVEVVEVCWLVSVRVVICSDLVVAVFAIVRVGLEGPPVALVAEGVPVAVEVVVVAVAPVVAELAGVEAVVVVEVVEVVEVGEQAGLLLLLPRSLARRRLLPHCFRIGRVGCVQQTHHQA